MTMTQDLQFGELIHQSGYKPDSHATFTGTYKGLPVIIKQGDSHLRHEETVLQAVNYTGIPEIVGYFEEKEKDVLVMKRISGVSLSRYIELGNNWQSRKLPLKEALRIVDGLAQCFEALHKAGYLYRDLNLSHVIVDGLNVGLVDYEWCVKMDTSGLGRVDSRAGTWETMAPEEFEVGNTIAPMSNTYTLGIVLLQLTTGKNPFFVSSEEISNSESQRLRAKELHQQLQNIHTGSKKIDHILNRSLRPMPEERYQSVAEFRGALIEKITETKKTPKTVSF